MSDEVSLKEYVESRLCALDKRVDTAVQNIKESTTSSFLASQKAIDKQENFQTVYNSSHNDLSRQMKEQYSLMIPRTEHEIVIQRIIEDIKSLRETRSEGRGEKVGSRELISWMVAGLSVIAMLFTILQVLK